MIHTTLYNNQGTDMKPVKKNKGPALLPATLKENKGPYDQIPAVL